MTPVALAYGRQSVKRRRDDRDGGSISFAYQRDAADRWCATHDTTLVGWYEDVDESGASTKRDGVNALIADVKRVKPDVVLFWDLKRLTRNLKFFLDMFDIFESVGAELVSCTEGTRHPAFVWKMLALFAEEERGRIRQNITYAKRKAAERGRHSGYAPIGYALNDTSDLTIDPERSWVVVWIFERALAGDNPTAIARAANVQGVPTATGKGPWTRSAIVRILTCATYAGIVQVGEAATSKLGKSLPVVRALGRHEPIVPLSDWETVQEALTGQSRPSAKRFSTHWMAGRVRCACCGARLYYVDAGRSDARYRDRFWRCASTYKRGHGIAGPDACSTVKRRISDRMLTDLVDAALYGAVSRHVTVEEVLADLDAGRAATARSSRQALERELAEGLRKRHNIALALADGAGDRSILKQMDRDHEVRIAAITSELAMLPAEPNRVHVAAAVEAAGQLADAWNALPPDDRTAALVQLGVTVTVHIDTATVALAFRDEYAFLAR